MQKDDDKKEKSPYPYPYPYPTNSPSPYKFDMQNPGKYPYPTPEQESNPEFPYPKSCCKFAHQCPVSDDLNDVHEAKECVHALKYGCPIFLIYFNEFEEFEEVDGVELFEVGQNTTKKYTIDDLKEIVKNFNELKDIHEPPIAVLGHDEDQSLLSHSGLPAAGWVKRLYVNGKKLFGDFSEVPSKIKQLISNGAYKKRSCEIYPNFQFGEKSYGKVLRRVALLGFAIPKVKGLANICARYKEGEKDKQELEVINVDIKFAEGFKSYLKRKKRIVDELKIDDPEKIYIAIEKAYMKEKLTDLEKKILQVGWPELHGKPGEEFKMPSYGPYPYTTAYPYPDPDKNKDKYSEYQYPYSFPEEKSDESENKILIKDQPYTKTKYLSEFGLDIYGRLLDVFDDDFLQYFSAASKDWEKRMKRIQEKTDASLLEIHIALGRSQGLWRGTGTDILSEQDKKILQAGWPEIYGKTDSKFVFRKSFAEEQKSGWTEEQLKLAEPILKIVEDAEKGNEKIEFEIDTAEIVELFFDVVRRRKTDPSEREKLILQTIWPQYFGDPNKPFKYSENVKVEKIESNTIKKFIDCDLIAIDSINKLKISDLSENQALLLYSDLVTGKNKSIDQKEQLFLQTGWPQIFGEPDKIFIYPTPLDLEFNSEEIHYLLSILDLGEGTKMGEEKTIGKILKGKNQITQEEALQQFSEELAQLRDDIKKRDDEIKTRDEKIDSLEKFAEEQTDKIENLQEERKLEQRQKHLTDIAMFAESLKTKGLSPAFVDEGGLVEYMVSLDSKTPVKFAEEDEATTSFDKFCELMKTMVSMNSKGNLFIPLKRLEKYDEEERRDTEVPKGVDPDGLKLNAMINKYAEENKISYEEAFSAKNWIEEL